MIKEVLKEIVLAKKKEGVPNFVIRNFLKEYLQFPTLNFIYNNNNYKKFIFTGGSCLRICFNAPRLSEDLDFDLLSSDYKKFDINKLAEDLRAYFKERYAFDVGIRVQSDMRIYLKFSVLKELGLAQNSESDFLYVKVEISDSDFIRPKTELSQISNYGFNFIIKNYTLEFLMAGKINALFNRVSFKGNKNEIDIKGRDFYDFFWYLQNGVDPDWKSLRKFIDVSNKEELQEKVIKIINKHVTSQKLSYDLKNFFPDQNFVNNFCKNYKELIKKYL